MDKTFCILIFFPYLSFLFLRSVDLFIIYFLFLIFISSSFIFLLLITSSFNSVFLSGGAKLDLLYVCLFSGCLFSGRLHSGRSLLGSSPLRSSLSDGTRCCGSPVSSVVEIQSTLYSSTDYSPRRCGSPVELSGALAAVKVVIFRLFVVIRFRLSVVIRFRLANFVLSVNQYIYKLNFNDKTKFYLQPNFKSI